jgi:hypothetical protein
MAASGFASSAHPWPSRVWVWAASMEEEDPGVTAGFLGLGDRIWRWWRERDGWKEEDRSGGVVGLVDGKRRLLGSGAAANVTILV